MRAIAVRIVDKRGLVVALAALACSAEPSEWQLMATIPTGAVRGELQSYIATRDDGTSEESYTLRPLGEQQEVPLAFATDPRLPSGFMVDVWGTESAGTLAVERFLVLGDTPGTRVERVAQAVRGGPAYPVRSFAFILVDTSNGVVPMNLPEAEATSRLFGTSLAMSPSVRQYFLEASYGRQDVTGQVFGPVPFVMTGCNVGALAQAMTAKIAGNFDHYLFYIHPRNGSCNWSGLAQSGRPERPSKNSWYNAASGCVVLVQEPGHNLGMSHSSAIKCDNAPFLDDPSLCSHQEYGDRYDPMGGGCRHMNSYQKAYQGWFDGCNLVAASASGTFTLVPLELACDGVQALQVPMPRVRPYLHGSSSLTELSHYYLELRTPRGIDQGLGPVVQVRVSNDTRSRSQRGVRTWFLDTKPDTATLDGLEVGETFTDPTGSPRFIVEALDDTRATVRVEIDGPQGGAVCGDGKQFEAPGPGPEACAAAPSGPEGTPPGPPPPAPISPPISQPPDGTVPTTDPLATACGCRVGATDPGPGAALVLFLAALLRPWRRRKRALPR